MIDCIRKGMLLLLCACIPFLLAAQSARLLTNHIGYETNGSKQAVILSLQPVQVTKIELIDFNTQKVVSTPKAVFKGKVDKWKNQLYWTIDFSNFSVEGKYIIRATIGNGQVLSHRFEIDKNLLERTTISDLIYYFKGQRTSGLFDKADRQLILDGRPADTIDAHGGWYDASGDYGKHLSHLSFSTYFNPQQTTLTAYSLFKSYELLKQRPGNDFRQFNRRMLDEAMYGADYLVRVQVKGGSFYRSVSAPGPGKFAKDRVIKPEQESYSIKKSKDQSFSNQAVNHSLNSYQVSFRSGGGLAIAALAMASGYDSSGDFNKQDYLFAAINAFDYLQKNNTSLTNDGKENIVDDYCALTAATELFKVTKEKNYHLFAEQRAASIIGRLHNWKKYENYWRADAADRPFFHPSDAGLPVVALLYYYPFAEQKTQTSIRQAVKSSMQFELAVTNEVNNPFGYGLRQWFRN